MTKQKAAIRQRAAYEKIKAVRPKLDIKNRPCISCKALFRSNGPYHRYCKRCRRRAESDSRSDGIERKAILARPDREGAMDRAAVHWLLTGESS